MGATIKHTATIAGQMTKEVECEWCACRFAYVQSAQATGTATTGWWNFWRDNDAVATSAAQAGVERQLVVHGPARCPSCGRFQSAMFGAIRRDWAARHTWKPVLLALLMIPLVGLFGPRRAKVGGFFESFLDRIFEFDLGWVAVIGLAVVAVSAIHALALRIDPNRDPDQWNIGAGTPITS